MYGSVRVWVSSMHGVPVWSERDPDSWLPSNMVEAQTKQNMSF